MHIAILESTASYPPMHGASWDWDIGSASSEAPLFGRRRPHLRIVDNTGSSHQDRALDATEEQEIKSAEQAIKVARAMRDVATRVRALIHEALLTAQPYSLASAIEMGVFLRSLSVTQRPSVFLLDNGNFQTVWRNNEREQISLQFFGDRVIQFAMFARRPGALPMARIAGQDNFDQVRAKITEHGCRHLIV